MKLLTNSQNTSKLILACCMCAAVLFTSTSQAGKLYKWVDAQGNVSYQDSPPPKNAKILEQREIAKPKPRSASTTLRGVPVIVYTVENCTKCSAVLEWLTEEGIANQERSLGSDREAQRRILNLSNGLTAPTLFIQDRIVVDTSREAMKKALKDAGYSLNSETKPISAPALRDRAEQEESEGEEEGE